MATTFSFELNNRQTRNQTYSIMLRITQNRKLKRVKTSVEVKNKKHFNSDAKQENWISRSDPNHTSLNMILSSELEKAKKTYRELKEGGLATPERIKTTLITEEKSCSFLKYAKERTNDIYLAGGFRNWKKYNGFCNKLEGFLTDKKGNIKDLSFAEVTPSFLSKFEAYLHSLKNERQPEKKLHPNTIQVNFNIFKTLVKRAIEIEGLLKPEKNPFMSFTYKGVKTMKEKLNEDEISLITGLSLPEGSLIWNCRNYFLFSFYCAGIRAGDLIQLRWCNISSEGRLIYEMGKNHKTKDIVLVSQAKDILSKYFSVEAKQTDYIFPLLDNNAVYAKYISQEDKDTMPNDLKVKLFTAVSAKNALINKELKKIALQAGIEKKVSFHISRHSFAKIAKDKKIDNNSLKTLLAHSSIKQTETYMGGFDTSVNDKALESIFESNKDQKADILSILGGLDPEELEMIVKEIKERKESKHSLDTQKG
jgi:site-specific recombinase XerD